MFGIRCGDKVIVLSGKDKGKVGFVKKVLRKSGKEAVWLFITGVGFVKRHYKRNEKNNINGGVYELESSIHISKVAIYNKELNKADKIICKIVGDKRYRVYKYTRKEF